MISGVGEPMEYVFTINGITVSFPELHGNMSLIENPSQDIHDVGIKLRNRLADDSYPIPMGLYTATISDLEYLMKTQSKDKHKLCARDIDPTDKMNFKSVLKICSEEVVKGLKEHVPQSDATRVYLTFLRDILHAFLAKKITAEERMYKMFNSLYFIRYCRAWLDDSQLHEHKASLTFISRNTHECIKVNAHTLFKVVIRCLKIGSFDNLVPWLLGNQPVESFFRICRAQSSAFSTVVNCTVHEATYNEPNGAVKIVLKRAIFWMLQEGHRKVSSDRLQRVRDNDLIDKSKLPRSSLPPNSFVHVAEQVNRGEWCLFRRLVTYDPRTPPCLVGRVKLFAYMDVKTKNKTRYSNKFVNVKNNSRQLGAHCDWYALGDDGILICVNSNGRGFLEIEQYECTIKPPLYIAGESITLSDVFSEIRSKCATKEQHDREIILQCEENVKVHQSKKRRTNKNTN
ncbi:hypothetical protein QAD02_000697 [Eretmocerus hayati]|uniref:Uncharacterized protein n=1 Tax=Eretmocerus hayati TaxID=131215 RepID=A0ACC2NF70_9HYME|nr:hypothetical protein QAD02_000697 [Eretmocerus hayati]